MRHEQTARNLIALAQNPGISRFTRSMTSNRRVVTFAAIVETSESVRQCDKLRCCRARARLVTGMWLVLAAVGDVAVILYTAQRIAEGSASASSAWP